MAKKAGTELPKNLINKTVGEVKSSTSIVEELSKEVATIEEKEVKNDKENIGVSLSSILANKKPKKPEKAKTMIYLDEHLLNQIKTVSMKSDLSVTKLIEMSLKGIFEGQEIDSELVEQYDNTNKTKGQRKPNKRSKK